LSRTSGWTAVLALAWRQLSADLTGLFGRDRTPLRRLSDIEAHRDQCVGGRAGFDDRHPHAARANSAASVSLSSSTAAFEAE
jgi:hypothetical protein